MVNRKEESVTTLLFAQSLSKSEECGLIDLLNTFLFELWNKTTIHCSYMYLNCNKFTVFTLQMVKDIEGLNI